MNAVSREDLVLLAQVVILHGGHVGDVYSSHTAFACLQAAGLALIDHDISNYPYLPATVTDAGRAVVEAMFAAATEAMRQVSK
jgi:hypothetical protein